MRILLAAFLICVLSIADAVAAPRVISEGATYLPPGRQFVLRSKAAGRDFLIQVSAPTGRPAKGRAPVIYVLDGNALFRPVTTTARELAGTSMAQAYVVAVGYPIDPATKAPGGDRLRDLVHVQAPYRGATVGGGGAAFETFLLRELVPFINARFPVDRKRSVLLGHSVGGLFATTVLAEHPYAFSGYFIASPSIAFDPRVVDRASISALRGRGRRVYISVGGEEGPAMVPAAERLGEALSRKGSTLHVRQKTFAGEDHMSVLGPMLAPGLSYLLPR